jgi:hypothetical protein
MLNVGIGETEHYNSVMEIRRLNSEQIHFWEYINGNQTFILDFHWPFICINPLLLIGPICSTEDHQFPA